ncbi:glycoside hydrolase family 18 protein [Lyophyllum atratum]|nr:glycoside hydrolase family 18 protein [Lyophyllum atratum]
MVLFTPWMAVVASALVYAKGVTSVAINGTKFGGLNDQAREIIARATPAAPHWVVYQDAWDGTIGPPAVSKIKGYNVFTLSFLLLEGAWDQAQTWTTLTAADRATIKSQYAAAGIKLIVSAFGSTDVPTTSGADPIATANTFAAWVKQYSLDGIDVDYEDFGAFESGKAEAWLISFTRQLRVQLPQGTYIVTHAPVAPWFTPNRWPGGGYLQVHSAVGSSIDWYNIQFYNQGSSEYTTCAGLLTSSSSTWPKSAVFQIGASGVPLSKIVIGKPATASDASNGFMSTSTLATCVQQAKNQGWNGGVMVWQYPSASASWIQSVRSLPWPV